MHSAIKWMQGIITPTLGLVYGDDLRSEKLPLPVQLYLVYLGRYLMTLTAIP